MTAPCQHPSWDYHCPGSKRCKWSVCTRCKFTRDRESTHSFEWPKPEKPEGAK